MKVLAFFISLKFIVVFSLFSKFSKVIFSSSTAMIFASIFSFSLVVIFASSPILFAKCSILLSFLSSPGEDTSKKYSPFTGVLHQK